MQSEVTPSLLRVIRIASISTLDHGPKSENMAPQIQVTPCEYSAATDLLVRRIFGWALELITLKKLGNSCLGLMEVSASPSGSSFPRLFILTTSGYGKHPLSHLKSKINTRLLVLQQHSAAESLQLSQQFGYAVTIEVALLDELRQPYTHFPPADWDHFSDQQLETCAHELVRRGCDMVSDTFRLCNDCNAQQAEQHISTRLKASFVKVILEGRYHGEVDSHVLAIAQWLHDWMQEAQVL